MGQNYIGRMEIKMPTTGTDSKTGKQKRKVKYLYFQMN